MGDGPTGSEVRQAWERFLARFVWTHFITLTFRNSTSVSGARRAVGKWLQTLNARVPGCLGYFWFIERGAEGDRVHVHVLLHGSEKIPIRIIELLWSGSGRIRGYGIAKAEVYDPARNGTGYVTKHMMDGDLDHDLGGFLPEE